MRTWWRARASMALATGAFLLMATAACTPDEPVPPPEERSPRPLPTAFTGDPPPGLAGEPIRYLHGPGAATPEILDDEMGVRIEALGDAFLISSNSEEKHALQRPADGAALWEGDRRIDGFGAARDGSPVLFLAAAERDATAVVDDTGTTVWSGADPREVFVGGVVVRRPVEWTAADPYGRFTVLDTEGDELWTFAFAEPDDGGSGAVDDGADVEADPDRFGVPVGAHGDVLLLDDGTGALQARGIGGGGTGAASGDLLWGMAGDDAELGRSTAVPRPRPRLVGFYPLPEDPDAADTPADDTDGTPSPDTDQDRRGADGDGADGDGGGGAGDRGGSGGADEAEDGKAAAPRETVLVRWWLPDARSVLSLHDLHDGDVLWTRTEPGANPGGRDFASGHLPGTVHDAATGTLLLPQDSGATPMIAVDLLTGEIRWEFADGAERSISPAFALDGHIYGDARGQAGGTQVVLDAVTKRTVAEDLDAYVEAVTDDGHAIVVQDRQRFVFAPADGGPDGSPPPPRDGDD
ncbi:hypothetical protein HNR23_004022 [Nocardiopsis mwathae]|uniref:PQQ-binding-like beta-propeller repeat protein n=1 Tax=Nocardiopsis mwathae TaxID=1472723 RepID=A0A7W9YKZ0_9ACTN|nr:hypothetical protein [Nocardiopsis mwathae]MBB6173962.1 hypothetical protein [Nocardiopsis mwathae]